MLSLREFFPAYLDIIIPVGFSWTIWASRSCRIWALLACTTHI